MTSTPDFVGDTDAITHYDEEAERKARTMSMRKNLRQEIIEIVYDAIQGYVAEDSIDAADRITLEDAT